MQIYSRHPHHIAEKTRALWVERDIEPRLAGTSWEE